MGSLAGLTNVICTSDYTATSEDGTILIDTAGGNVTITLPAASKAQFLFIKRISSGINTASIARAGSDTIEGAASLSLVSQFSSRILISDGVSTWYTGSTI